MFFKIPSDFVKVFIPALFLKENIRLNSKGFLMKSFLKVSFWVLLASPFSLSYADTVSPKGPPTRAEIFLTLVRFYDRHELPLVDGAQSSWVQAILGEAFAGAPRSVLYGRRLRG